MAVWLLGAPVWQAATVTARFALTPTEAFSAVVLPLTLGGLALPALLAAACGARWAAPVLWALVALALLVVAACPVPWPDWPPWPLVMMPLALVAVACHRAE